MQHFNIRQSREFLRPNLTVNDKYLKLGTSTIILKAWDSVMISVSWKCMQWLHYKIYAPICMKVSSSWPLAKSWTGIVALKHSALPPIILPFLPLTLHSLPPEASPPPWGVSRSSWDIPTFWATEAYEQAKSEDTAVISYFKFSLFCHFTNPWWNYFFDNMESWVH